MNSQTQEGIKINLDDLKLSKKPPDTIGVSGREDDWLCCSNFSIV